MRIFFINLFSLLLFCAPSVADMIVLKDPVAKPVYGRIVQRTEKTIVLDEIRSTRDLAPRRVRLAISDVEIVVSSIDENRLETLRPDQLAKYQNYAEELAMQKADPVARELAIRLFLIVGYWSNDQTASGQSSKHGALNALVELARDEKELQVFRSLVKLYGPEASTKSKPSQRSKVANSQSDLLNDNQLVLEMIRLIRQNKNSQFLEKLKDERIARAIDSWSEVCDRKELVRMANQNRLDASDLRRLLKIELAIENGQTMEQVIAGQKTKRTGSAFDWSIDAKRMVPGRLLLPRLERVTEFDPKKAIYRRGRWVRTGESR